MSEKKLKAVMMLHITCGECGREYSIPMDYEENQYCDCGELLAGIGEEIEE